MKRSMLALIIVAVILALTPVSASANNIILNGSFESPVYDPATWYAYGPGPYTTEAPTDWNITQFNWAGVWNPYTSANKSVWLGVPHDYSAYNQPVPDGTQVAWVNSGAMYQDTSAVLTAGTTYTVIAYVGQRDDYASGSGDVLLETAGGQVLNSSGWATPTAGSFEPILFSYTAHNGDPNLGQGLSVWLENEGAQADFDEVSLTASSSTVPEPSALVGLASLGAMGLIRALATAEASSRVVSVKRIVKDRTRVESGVGFSFSAHDRGMSTGQRFLSFARVPLRLVGT